MSRTDGQTELLYLYAKCERIKMHILSPKVILTFGRDLVVHFCYMYVESLEGICWRYIIIIILYYYITLYY